MTIARTDTDMHEALYKVACDFPKIPGTETKGIPALAQILGMSPVVLRNKLSPDVKTHKVSFEEASAIMELCARAGMEDAYAPLMAMNWRHGFVANARDEEERTDDESIHDAGAAVMQHIGEAMGELRLATKDGHICDAKLQKIESKGRRAAAWLFTLLSRARGRAKKDASKRGFFGKRVDQSTRHSATH